MKNLRDYQIVMSKPFDLLEYLRTDFPVEEQLNLLANLGTTVGCVVSSLING